MNYSIDFDGHSVIEVMALSPDKLTFPTIQFWVKLEGGFIDDNCIIHRGSAVARDEEYNKEKEYYKQKWLNKRFHIVDFDSMVRHDILIRDGIAKGAYLLTKDERVRAGIAEYTKSELKRKKTEHEILMFATDRAYRDKYRKEHPEEFRETKPRAINCYPGWVNNGRRSPYTKSGKSRIFYSVSDCDNMRDVMEKYGSNPKANFMRVLQLCLEAGLI